MTPPQRKELQDDLRELVIAHAEYEELMKKVFAIGSKIRTLVINAEKLLDET
jgi:hypothetical protein